jgi:two-component system cell cycle response regulator DivK
MEKKNHTLMAPEMPLENGCFAKILVVDDDAINLMVLEQMLAAGGFPVVNAVDGLDAVEKAMLIRPLLVLMDISMPKMNGIDAAIAIRKRSAGQSPKIVAVTANVTTQQRRDCETAGFDGFLAKPVDMKELLHTVATFLA